MSEAKSVDRKRLDAVMRKVFRTFGHLENLRGVDVGFKWRSGHPTETICVRVHVERKVPVDELEPTDVLPREFEGAPIDLIDGAYRIAQANGSPRHDVKLSHVVGGISCGRIDGNVGTIGAVVIDNLSGRPCVLSNWHVLAGVGARRGDEVLQPGLMDGGDPRFDRIGTLSRWMLDSDGDAAIAELDGNCPWLPTQLSTYLPFGEIRESRLGEVLVKSARSTARTQGRVDGEGIYRLSYEVRPGVVETRDIHGFKLVTRCDGATGNRELSSSGDSGALWQCGETGDVVGLQFARYGSAEPRSEHVLACNMTKIAERLDVRIAGFGDLLASAPASAETRSSDVAMGSGHSALPERLDADAASGIWVAAGSVDVERAVGVDAVTRTDTRKSEPRMFGTRDPRAEFEQFEDVWHRMKCALGQDPGLDRLVIDILPIGAPLEALSDGINGSGAFVGCELRPVSRQDFCLGYTFKAACLRVVEILSEGGQSK